MVINREIGVLCLFLVQHNRLQVVILGTEWQLNFWMCVFFLNMQLELVAKNIHHFKFFILIEELILVLRFMINNSFCSSCKGCTEERPTSRQCSKAQKCNAFRGESVTSMKWPKQGVTEQHKRRQILLIIILQYYDYVPITPRERTQVMYM